MKWKKLVPQNPRETISKEVCDFCGKEYNGWRARSNTEVTIESSVGNVYPEGDFRKVQAFDCCYSCWEYKVVPALTALGGKVYEYSSEDGRLEDIPLDKE